MSNFKSTIYAYDYYLQDNGGLFDGFSLPDGLDTNLARTVILLECGEMTPLYTDPEFMQMAVGLWSAKWASTFERWANALAVEYDPLNNYDRHEEWTDQLYHTVGGSAETAKSAYDSATLTPYDKVTTNDAGNSFDTRNGHTYGNIGITTSQEMLRQELSIAEWNVYNHIKDLFMQELCISIY